MAIRDQDVLYWAPDLEPHALEQTKRVSRLSFVEKPVALMADAHFGPTVSVGSVIATNGAIILSAVGSDIGCGILAARLNIKAKHLPDNLKSIHDGITKLIPAGVGKGFAIKTNPNITNPWWFGPNPPATEFSARHWVTAETQIGTLGAGNHFIEISLDTQNRVWLVIHSGSRGIGSQLAQDHIAKAKGLMKDSSIQLEDLNLAYLTERSIEFENYIADLQWSQDYAASNRKAMLQAVMSAIRKELRPRFRDITIEQTIDTSHNFTRKEHHHGKDLWVTRKGAISASIGEPGVIGGSMATGTYITTGLGNPDSYHSCSHGAGRIMSRAQARDSFSVKSLNKAMSGKQWNADAAGKLLDEHPRAYKNIEEVMANQKDLVQIDEKLTQILNYKGADR
jgi:tRNA-splicing ligase RtcB